MYVCVHSWCAFVCRVGRFDEVLTRDEILRVLLVIHKRQRQVEAGENIPDDGVTRIMIDMAQHDIDYENVRRCRRCLRRLESERASELWCPASFKTGCHRTNTWSGFFFAPRASD